VKVDDDGGLVVGIVIDFVIEALVMGSLQMIKRCVVVRMFFDDGVDKGDEQEAVLCFFFFSCGIFFCCVKVLLCV
jgi:hypothetical protein